MDYQRLLQTTEQILVLRGSAGSGNYGHDGRPGKLGGSSKGGGLKRIGVKKDTPAGDRKKAAKEHREKRTKSPKSSKITIARGTKPDDVTLAVDKKVKDWYMSREKPLFDHPLNSLGGYIISQTRSVADENTNALSKDSGLSKEDVKDYLFSWARSPNEAKKEGYIKLQQAALEKFNIIKDVRQELPYSADDKARKILDSSYKLTQEEFKKRGIKELTLYRGASNAKPGKYNGNALDSWTLDPKVAQGYASLSPGESKGVMKMKVPVERIAGTAFTGIGTLDNYEFVVIGGENAGNVEIVSANQVSKSDTVGLLQTTESILTLRGGRGSGNWGHSGRPGKKGGSVHRQGEIWT